MRNFSIASSVFIHNLQKKSIERSIEATNIKFTSDYSTLIKISIQNIVFISGVP